ncbi:hypothetical protein HC931_27680 [Candidatus Gracilibacteria bacterium]|jgi:hypothetical protein|nr:hypothetical protein [Candidatus Gracilibacteria bacterium]NJM90459.1 hypothetical protein [Hydrococcus sp. RU_2_2]NJP22286.1 hypothetical protein [Hydrococcus sp. CRU_1_1]
MPEQPTFKQLQKLYIVCYTITNVMFQPIYIVRIDERTGNIFVLAGAEEEIELEITPTGELVDEPS